jgi:hypothetical protein
MASAEVVRPDMDEAISPRQAAPSIEQAISTIGPLNNPLNPLDLRVDPDAQATVSDFLDFTEYLPADMTRSLTLIGKLDQTYLDSSDRIHELTTLWGQLPSIPSAERTKPVDLRGDISENLHQALNTRVYSLAEAQRMTEIVNRHYSRAKTILSKLDTMLENYPAAEEQKSPVTTKSPQLSRAPKIAVRADGQRVRRPPVPRITVPGEVLAPYELNYDAYLSSSESSSEEEEDQVEKSSNRVTPAPQARIKVVKATKTPKPGRTPRPRSSVPPPNPPAAGLSTSAAMAQLAPPPDNAVIGSSDAPWGQLTAYELARLRKRMKKNAAWIPSDTMVARELSALGRGVDAFRAAKQKAEAEGRVFEGQMPVPTLDPDTGEKRMPLGALTLEALESDEKNLSNRGMKLNEAKKLKRELLAKMAAEEAEESARRFDAIAKTLMSDATPANNVQDQSARTTARAKAQRKRKRDSAPDTDVEKTEGAAAQAQRPQFKRTKTETPVPPPILTPGASQISSQETPAPHAQRLSTAGIVHSTTPIPLPIQGQDQSITAKSGTSATSPASSIAGGANNIPPVKLPPTETPIPPPVLSPKKSTTPILPPARETRLSQAARAQQQTALPVPATLTSRSTSPEVAPKPEPDAAGAAISVPSAAPAPTSASSATTTTTVTTRRPASRGKATSQEPQPSLAADRPRRASTARNTPAPEQSASTTTASGAPAAGAAARTSGKRTKRPAPGIISRTNSGGNSAVGMRKAAPRKKRAAGAGGRRAGSGASAASSSAAAAAATSSTAASGAGAGAGAEVLEVEVDDEGNIIDPDEPRYCLCNRVSFGTMIQCDNVDVSCFLFLLLSEDAVVDD